MKKILVLRHVSHEGLGAIADALAQQGAAHVVVDLFAQSPQRFSPTDWSGLIVMGGLMNVDDTAQFPFLADQVRWLRQAIEARLPVLGVCLGSQLLAKALGANVFKNRVKEIGWHDVELLPAAETDLLFAGIPSPMTAFHWHGDTFDLPNGAVQLARSARCENQAFRFGTSAYGLQFHLEMTAAMIDHWLTHDDNCAELATLPDVDPAEIRSLTPQKLPAMQAIASNVFQRFAQWCVQPQKRR